MSASSTPRRDGAALSGDFWRRSFARLYLSGWRSSLLVIVLCLTISVLLFGFWMPYWKVADMDMILASQALLLNDGQPQQYFDHTGYLNDLLLATWYWLLHGLGILRAHAISTLPSPADAGAYEHAWQQLIVAGRALSLLLGVAFVWSFAALIRRLLGDWRTAVLAALALAYSGGFLWHIRIIRTELLSAGLFTSSLLMALVAAREPGARRFLLIVGSSLCAVLAIVSKVQALFPALAIPVLALAFGKPDDESLKLGGKGRWVLAAFVLVLAAILAYPAASLLRLGMSGMAAYPGYRSTGLSGTYQWLIAPWVVGWVLAYAIIWRSSVADTLAAMAGVALGASIGILSLLIYYDLRNVVAVANPIEHMLVFASGLSSAPSPQPQLVGMALFGALARGIGQMLAAHTFILAPSGRPTLLVEWFALAGIVVLWRRGERSAAMQAALLILAAWGIDAVFSLRELKLYYFVYTDPLLILAAAIVVAHWPELARSPRLQHLALAVLAITIVWGHLEPVRQAVTRGEPEQACSWLPLIKQIGPFPFCRS
jgi:hypothetical protein